MIFGDDFDEYTINKNLFDLLVQSWLTNTRDALKVLKRTFKTSRILINHELYEKVVRFPLLINENKKETLLPQLL